MTPISLRLPPDLIVALKSNARDRGLDMASYVRATLIAGLDKPVNIIKHVPRTQ